MNFKDFKKDVESAFNAMIADNLFVVNVDKDLQNSDNCVVLKTVSPQILDKLRESGLTVCTCCEFPGTAWLVFRPNMPTSDIHGEGYDFEEIGLFGTEAVLKYFEANTPNYVDCGTDVDKFINICLQFK